MINVRTFGAAVAGAAAIGLGCSIAPAQAASLTYDFTVNVNSGALQGQQYNGFFSFDNSLLKGTGAEQITPADGLKVAFNFLGNNYTESSDGDFPKFPIVDFFNGALQGLSFSVHDRTTTNPFNFFAIGSSVQGSDGGGNYFIYGNIDQNFAFSPEGDGIVSYQLHDGSTSVPTPALLPGLFGLGAAALKKRKQEQSEQVAETVEV